MIQVHINVTETVSSELAAFIGALTGPQTTDLCQQGGMAARNAAVAYHREFDQSGGWRGKRYLGPSQNDGTDFGATVASGWQLEPDATASGVSISNDAAHYAYKVHGGTITPKRAGALTIPLIREAKGVRASVYVQNTGRKLFTIRGKNALFERTETTVTGSRGRRGQAGATAIRKSAVRAVYALVKSVTQAPWPGALPPDDVISGAFVEAYHAGLIRILDAS